MLSQNTNALGIIFPNSYDNTVPELVTERAMASIPFAGRYRMLDFGTFLDGCACADGQAGDRKSVV